MRQINHFKKKGGKIVWDEMHGSRCSYKGITPMLLLIEIKTDHIFEVSELKWNEENIGFYKAKGLF